MLAIGYKLVNSYDNISMIVRDSDYITHYHIGKVIKARPNTLGLMIFKDLDSVLQFVNRLINNKSNIQWDRISLIEVVYDSATSKEDNTIRISLFCGGPDLDIFYSGYQIATLPIPAGTVCCPEVYVNREILTGHKPGGGVC